jgi:hypothetical protein
MKTLLKVQQAAEGRGSDGAEGWVIPSLSARATRNDAGTPVGAGMPARRNPYAVVNTKDVPCTQ